jgi:predicted kinase
MGTVLWIPRGLPASGKTTWAREMVDRQPIGSIVRLNRDDVRAMMFGPDYRTPKHDGEERVSAVQHGPIVELLRSGADVIVDDTNLRVRHVKSFLQMAARAGAGARIVDDFLDVDVEECVRRDAGRPRPVGEVVIRGMWEKHLRGGRRPHVPFLDEAVTGEPYIPTPGTPHAVMVDIDGTVALHGDRNPYDTSRYHEDTPNAPVVAIVQNAATLGHRIVFCSGRSEEFRAVTEEWLNRHVLLRSSGWELHMRPAGDVRNDAVVKLELFDQHVRSRFRVAYVLDDRDRVVRAWRSIGLTVLQVADGDF